MINKLDKFLLELGKGFTFESRQKRISFDEKHFYIDLVFYNRILQCFVLVDLKIGELKHQDLGQMQMYVNYYDRYIKLEHENKTIGIILCRDKNEALVEITLPETNEQIFASRYKTVLPDKEELKRLLSNEEPLIIRIIKVFDESHWKKEYSTDYCQSLALRTSAAGEALTGKA